MASPTPTLQNFILRAQKIFKGIWERRTTPSSSLPSDVTTAGEISQLTNEMNRLTATNTGIHSMGQNLRNPITFVNVVHDNPILQAVIIFIKPGHVIPLHDHPEMFGLIKVLCGQVKVRSYSLASSSSSSQDKELKISNGKVHPAIRSPDVILNNSSYPEAITPDFRNIHEIECIGGEGEQHNYAAFLDVLSPPYNDLLDDACHYFDSKEKDRRKPYDGGDESSRQVYLVETRCPRDYVTASFSL